MRKMNKTQRTAALTELAEQINDGKLRFRSKECTARLAEIKPTDAELVAFVDATTS